MNKLSKKAITLISIGVVALLVIGYALTKYNDLVSQDENVSKYWGDLQAQYQRRNDLIPNLVNTVKGYAEHEQSTLKAVIEARSKATQITVDAENLTPEKMQEMQKVQGELSSALGKLLAITENYPNLKASEQFQELQAQLEGTENRINNSRQEYNTAVQNYNLVARRFPGNIIAGMFGFSVKPKFEAEQGAQKAPSVSFE